MRKLRVWVIVLLLVLLSGCLGNQWEVEDVNGRDFIIIHINGFECLHRNVGRAGYMAPHIADANGGIYKYRETE